MASATILNVHLFLGQMWLMVGISCYGWILSCAIFLKSWKHVNYLNNTDLIATQG